MIAIGRAVIRIAERHVNGARDLLVEESVENSSRNVRVQPKGEFANTACPFIAVQNAVQPGFVAFGRRLDYPAVPEDQADGREDRAFKETGAVEPDLSVDGISHGCGEDLSVRDIEMAVALDYRDSLDREAEIGVRTDNPDQIRTLR